MRPDPAASPLTAQARAMLASDRLVRNRERLSGWLEQDRREQSARLSGGWLAGALRPVLKGLDAQPLALLALDALATGYAHRARSASEPPLPLQVIGTALSVARRHPRLSLAVAALAGATWLWCRWPRNRS